MAQTNYTPIILYNSGTTTNAPSASNLASGELAINYTDGKLFYKDNNSAIQVIGWKTTPTTAGGTGLTSYTAGDLPYYSSGSALSKLGIGTSGYVLESNGSAPTWVAQSTLSVGTATNATNTAITDNTSSSATWYPTIVSATTGNLPQTTSSTKLSFVPSTGTLTTSYLTPTNPLGVPYGGTGLTSLTSGYIPYGNGTSAFNSSSNLYYSSNTLYAPNLQGPAFSVYPNTNQTLPNVTAVKIQCNTKIFDTNNNFDATTNYRFTPTVAGYYQINYGVVVNNASSVGVIISSVYKNGSAISSTQIPNNISNGSGTNGSVLVYMNGSTDYLELYALQTSGVGMNTNSINGTQTYFNGALLRSA